MANFDVAARLNQEVENFIKRADFNQLRYYLLHSETIKEVVEILTPEINSYFEKERIAFEKATVKQAIENQSAEDMQGMHEDSQQQLFDTNANGGLAREAAELEDTIQALTLQLQEYAPLRVIPADVQKLQSELDALRAEHPELYHPDTVTESALVIQQNELVGKINSAMEAAALEEEQTALRGTYSEKLQLAKARLAEIQVQIGEGFTNREQQRQQREAERTQRLLSHTVNGWNPNQFSADRAKQVFDILATNKDHIDGFRQQYLDWINKTSHTIFIQKMQEIDLESLYLITPGEREVLQQLLIPVVNRLIPLRLQLAQAMDNAAQNVQKLNETLQQVEKLNQDCIRKNSEIDQLQPQLNAVDAKLEASDNAFNKFTNSLVAAAILVATIHVLPVIPPYLLLLKVIGDFGVALLLSSAAYRLYESYQANNEYKEAYANTAAIRSQHATIKLEHEAALAAFTSVVETKHLVVATSQAKLEEIDNLLGQENALYQQLSAIGQEQPYYFSVAQSPFAMFSSGMPSQQVAPSNTTSWNFSAPGNSSDGY